MARESKQTENAYTLGKLLGELISFERAYESNMREANRIRSEHGSLVAYHTEFQARLLKWRPNLERMPGIDRIELLCDERFGSGITIEAIRRIRSELCQRCDISLEGSNNLTLTQVADLLTFKSSSKASEEERTPDVLERLHNRYLKLQGIQVGQERGYALEQLLTDLFAAYELAPRGSFRMMGEQIDGSFEWQGNVFLVEARWRSEPANAGDLLVLRGKAEKSDWTRGLFISINGFSDLAMPSLQIGRKANLIAMSGQDLILILEQHWTLHDALRAKLRHTGETAEAYKPLAELTK